MKIIDWISFKKRAGWIYIVELHYVIHIIGWILRLLVLILQLNGGIQLILSNKNRRMINWINLLINMMIFLNKNKGNMEIKTKDYKLYTVHFWL
jgi:hypothetical protein